MTDRDPRSRTVRFLNQVPIRAYVLVLVAVLAAAAGMLLFSWLDAPDQSVYSAWRATGSAFPES